VIDYEEVVEKIVGGTIVSKNYFNKRRYKLDLSEPTRSSYPFNDFREVYTAYKNFEGLSLSEQLRISNLRSVLLNYVIPPRPITLNDTDVNIDSSIPSRNIIMSYSQNSFTYISGNLNQNVFDITNIQLKWYYLFDPVGLTWDIDTEVNFGMSIRAHLKNIDNSANDINDIFYIPDNSNGGVTYKVNKSMFDMVDGRYKYINHQTGEVMTSYTISSIPKLLVTLGGKSPRIDFFNNYRYKLQVEYTMVNFSSSDYKFFLYSGPIIINGTAPIRTSPTTNTLFTLKIENNVLSPIVNDVKYRFEITPFNMNDFFPNTRNRIEQLISTTVTDPITDMSYSLISTSVGGAVLLKWRYAAPSDYQINIIIPDEYRDGMYPDEYPVRAQFGGRQSIFANNVRPNDGVVNYKIPSDDIDVITTDFVDKYLKSGRGYAITVAPVKRIEINGEEKALPAESRNMFTSGTYVVPFRTPQRPTKVSGLGNNGSVLLYFVLPNIKNDPNYYITVYPNPDPNKQLPFYRYRFYLLEKRNVSAGESSWTVISSSILIPSGSLEGYVTTYNVTGLPNENNHQFRVSLIIVNDYNGQQAFSDYTYLSNINTTDVIENESNTIYPSLYPYTPSAPILRSARRTYTSTGALNGLAVTFDYPVYNANSEYYECYIEYSPPQDTPGSGTLWYDIFDTREEFGIANINDNLNTVLDSNRRLSTSLISQSTFQKFVITCKSNVESYGIRIRLIGRKVGLAEPYPFVLFSNYSTEDYIEI
ncbi:hypothetical protein EBU71_13335, partial [bacterium]|nr:hypothetical protein [Candidatus Elulimicrobium humile]